MADEDETLEDEIDEVELAALAAKAKRKKTLTLGGGLVGLVAVGYVLMLMAVPSYDQRELTPYDGPFVVPLSETDIQVNLAGPGRQFLSINANLAYEAYDEGYVAERVTNPVYLAQLKDVMITLGTQKERSQLEEPAGKAIFKEELHQAINDLLFPLHIGDGSEPAKPDESSGLAPGLSFEDSDYRAGIRNGRVFLDVVEKTIRLDDGEPVRFEGHEPDLLIETALGRSLYVDVTRLTDGFQGEIAVGVHGQIEDIFWHQFLLQ